VSILGLEAGSGAGSACSTASWVSFLRALVSVSFSDGAIQFMGVSSPGRSWMNEGTGRSSFSAHAHAFPKPGQDWRTRRCAAAESDTPMRSLVVYPHQFEGSPLRGKEISQENSWCGSDEAIPTAAGWQEMGKLRWPARPAPITGGSGRLIPILP